MGTSEMGKAIESLDEQALYGMELRIIKRNKKHLPSVKPRPIKIDNELKPYAEAGDSLAINLRVHKSKREVELTLAHELIHYQLKDDGKEYSGHGKAFRKLAKTMGVLTYAELHSCLGTTEEAYTTPHRIESVRVPLADCATEITKALADLELFVEKVPIKIRERFFSKVHSISTNWSGYQSAVISGADYVVHQTWKPRRGPRGKPLQELTKEAGHLSGEYNRLQREWFEDPGDKRKQRAMLAVESKLEQIQRKLKRDYGKDIAY